MSDKDKFTFDDDDDFPEADLSSAFSDGEFEAENSASVVQQEPERVAVQKSMHTDKSAGAGGSRTRILLLVLLLVVAGSAGAYYFMDLGGTTPVVPTAPAPAQKAQKTVALPPQPASAPPAEAPAAAKPVSIAVPPPPPAQPVTKPVTEETAKAAAEQPPAAAKAEPVAVAKPASQTVADQNPAPAARPIAQAKPAAQEKPDAEVKTAQQAAEVKVATAPKPVPKAVQASVPKQVAGGGFALDAGSYLLESNRDSLVARITKLGYEPLVTQIDAKLDMTRLRLGTYRKEDVEKTLDLARSIEPGAYSAPAGDGYVIYAGTFLRQGTVDRLTRLFLAEGIKVHPEPVQVVRSLSRIRFGSFATREDAMAAANAAGEAGIKSVVVAAH